MNKIVEKLTSGEWAMVILEPKLNADESINDKLFSVYVGKDIDGQRANFRLTLSKTLLTQSEFWEDRLIEQCEIAFRELVSRSKVD